MEFNKFIEKYFDENDDSGFNEIVFQRQEKLKKVRERLRRYYLTEEEIDKLFDIIVKAEMEMEQIKRKFNSKKYTPEDLDNFQQKLIDIQNKMKEEFDKKLNQKLKEKYEAAKKLKAKMDKENGI